VLPSASVGFRGDRAWDLQGRVPSLRCPPGELSPPMTAGSPPSFPLRGLAALFLARQHLARPRARRLTARSLTQLVTDTAGLQIDSINVVDRAHYLTL